MHLETKNVFFAKFFISISQRFNLATMLLPRPRRPGPRHIIESSNISSKLVLD